MIRITVSNVLSSATELKVLTAGMVDGRAVCFSFSEDWDKLNKTAVFTNELETRIIPEYKWVDNTMYIPPEVLTTPFQNVKCGVYGMDENGEVIIPTLWADLGKVFPSASPGEYSESVPPTPNTWDDLQNQVGVLSKLKTHNKSNLVGAMNELFDSIPTIEDIDGIAEKVIALLPKYDGEVIEL